MRREILFLFSILLLSSCGHNLSVADMNITVVETLQADEILPLLGDVNFFLDSLKARETLTSGNALLTDSIHQVTKEEIDTYLKNNRTSILFDSLHFNFENLVDKEIIKKSSFIASCFEKDTTWVSEVLKRTGKFPQWININWMPSMFKYNGTNIFYFIALKPATKIITIPAYDIENVEISQPKSSLISQIVDKMNKLNPYFLNVKLKQDAVKNLQSEFRLHDAVMLKCSYKGMLIYYSTTVSSICNNAGFSIFIPNDVQAKL